MQQTASQRKIQRLGGSSLIVTIPKSWARRMGLKPGDNVIVIDDGDSLRILPPSRANGDSGLTVRIKYSSAIKAAGLTRIAYCAFVFGYRRLIVETTLGLKEYLSRDIDKLEEEMGDVISGMREVGDAIVIEFKDSAHLEKSRIIKSVNTAIQGVLDLVDLKARLGEDVGDESREDAIKMYASLMRTLVMDSPAVSGRLVADVIAASMVHLILQLSLALLDTVPPGNPDASSIVGKLKLIVSEALGGLASGSTKRAVVAIEEAEKLIQEIASRSGGEAYLGIAYSLALAAKHLALKTICKSAIPS